MKILAASLLLLSALLLPATAQVPVRPGDVRVDKVVPNVVRTPEYQISGGQSKRYKIGEWLEVEAEFTTAPEFIDELTFTYKIAINNKLLVGEVTHVSIPKGKEHFSVVYVSPRSLERVMEGKAFNAAALQGVWVDVSKSGQVLAQFTTAKGAAPNLPQLPGLVVNKNDSPFALLYWDRYEAIKSSR